MFGEKVGGNRAKTCWSVIQCLPVWSWLDCDADSYVYPHRGITQEDETELEIIVEHCTDALACAVRSAWAGGRDTAVKPKIKKLLSALSFDDALMRSARVQGDWYAPSLRSRFWPRGLSRRAIIDLDAIAILDRAIVALRKRQAIGDSTLDLTRVAFHASLNPVSVRPATATLCASEFASVELFAVAAWLGHLYRGRRAVMPEFVANYLLMVLGEKDRIDAPDWPPDRFLVEMATTSVGLERLRRRCVDVLKQGPSVVYPA